jgi:asparagine synthase (glutamine-hydrolysing)
MCGIVGAINLKSSPFRITEPYIKVMRDTMINRGPDGAGVWVSDDGNVGMGHRRLSIVDLSESASQPMCNKGQTVWLAFNGEIYNHAEIKNTLSKTGKYEWSTDHSDTEVILHAFEEWGIEFIHQLRGMFAICIYDTVNKEAWLVRDRIGIKPLYYSIVNERIIFASEIKALLKDPDQKREVNEEALFHYLSFLTTPAPQTLFDGIKKLPPGTWLKVDTNGVISQNCYWDVLDHTNPRINDSEEDLARDILKELNQSVKLRKLGDVPVGVFLSGGIDSSANAALFSRGENKPIKTFCIGYDGEYGTYQNETQYAKNMAEKIGSDHYEKLLTQKDLIDFLPLMIKLQDEPIADPVCVPLYYVSKLARESGVTVCQVGEGADELFWGYSGWKRSIRTQLFLDRFPRLLLLKPLAAIFNVIPGIRDRFQVEWLRRAGNSQPIFWGGAEAFSENQKKRLFSKRLKKKFARSSSWSVIEPIRARFLTKAWERTNLSWMSYLDLNLRLPELLLMRVDKMSMGVSLEGRVPFLDHKFVELGMSIPESVKTKNGILKHTLKMAVRGLVPDEIIDRKKQGFDVPIHEWFLGGLGNYAKNELMTFCDETDYFDKHEVAKLFVNGHGRKIWFLLNFALWWKEYIKEDPRSA